MTNAKTYKLGKLAELLQVDLLGDPECEINGLATLKNAITGKLSFLSNPAYVKQLPDCKASAVILSSDFIEACNVNKLVTDAPYLTYARASHLFESTTAAAPSIHETAVIDNSADIAGDVSVGPNTVIAADVVVGAGSVIGSGCYLGQGASIGNNCHLHSNISIYHRVAIGNHVIIHSSVVIGADGFGYAPDGEKSIKIAQLGSVSIADDVEIGAGSTIDRGALDDTVIEEGVKIDNQVQIGHNCFVGAHSIICGCTAIAGSAVIGRNCVLGGATGMVGHISIADGVKVSAMSLVSTSIDKAGTYSSGTGIMESSRWKRNIVRFSQLDDLWRRLRKQGKTDKN